MKGLLAVFTGNGKGKTTSAFGMALRSAGHGNKVCIVQFIKGGWQCGEQKAVEMLNDRVDLFVRGRGFTWKSDDPEKDVALARKGWSEACVHMKSGKYDMVVLDELTYLVKYEMLRVEDILAGIEARDDKTHVIITGRNAHPDLVEAADLVTEMKEIKHPLSKGIKAQKGFEF